MKPQIGRIQLSVCAARPTLGKPLAVMQVGDGWHSFNAVNQIRVRGRWTRTLTLRSDHQWQRRGRKSQDAMRFFHGATIRVPESAGLYAGQKNRRTARQTRSRSADTPVHDAVRLGLCRVDPAFSKFKQFDLLLLSPRTQDDADRRRFTRLLLVLREPAQVQPHLTFILSLEGTELQFDGDKAS